jgi:hypothetical protein
MKDSIKHIHQILMELQTKSIDASETAQEIYEDVRTEHNAHFDPDCKSVECKKSSIEVNIIEDLVKRLHVVDASLGDIIESFVSHYPEVNE